MARIFSNIKQKIESKSDFYTLSYTKETMKGLSNFINDIRHCKSRVAENKRVNKELANIRSKFRADKNIDGYHKKKYVAKLSFIHLLGYDVNFGQSEAIYLLCSNKFSEKQIGYLFLSMLPDLDDEQFCKTMVCSISADIRSHNHHFVILAAHCVPNVLCRQIIIEIGNDMLDLIKSNNNELITQSLLSCYLAMIKYDQQYFKQNTALNDFLLKFFVTANDNVLLPLACIFFQGSQMEPIIFGEAVSGILSQIHNLTKPISNLESHVYYGIQSPWTIIKLLQCIQAFPIPQNCESQVNIAVLSTIRLGKVTIIDLKKLHQPNICNALVFEAINVIASKRICTPCIPQAIEFLIGALKTSVNNYRYFAMEALLKIKDYPNVLNFMKPVAPLLIEIVTKETNTPLRLKSVDVLYATCEPHMLRTIVDSLIDFLKNCELNIREELTLKIFMMAMKVLNEDIRWFVDTMMDVMEYAGLNSSEDIWHKILHVITNYPKVQNYAAKIAMHCMKKSNTNEKLVMLSAYILGEFGDQLYNVPDFTAQIQVTLLLDFFPFVELTTKYILITSLFKIANKSTTVRPIVMQFFSSDAAIKNIDCEIQQRCCEYLTVLKSFEHMLPTVLESMPDYIIEEAIATTTSTKSESELSGDVSNSMEYIVTPDETGRENQYNIMPADVCSVRPSKKGSINFNDFLLKFESSFKPPEGSIFLRIEHLINPTEPISIVDAQVNDHKALKTASLKIDANMRDSCQINFVCMDAYDVPPSVTIIFKWFNTIRGVTFELPVYIEHFTVPYNAGRDKYLSIWNSLAMEILTLDFKVSKLATMEEMMDHLTMNLGLQHVPDTSPVHLNRSYIGIFTSKAKNGGLLLQFIGDEKTQTFQLLLKCNNEDFYRVLGRSFRKMFKIPDSWKYCAK